MRPECQPEWQPQRRLGRRLGLWPLIILLHGLLLLAHLPRSTQQNSSSAPTLVVQLLPAPPTPRRVAPASGPARPASARAPRAAAPGLTPPAANPAHAGDPPPAPDAREPAPVDAVPSDASPAPMPLLQTEATRQAIRLATRAPLLSERAASASEAPARETAQQRFGREVARTAYGNCLKGEFPGAGAGLLSLPMFLIAEASGRCQK